MFEFLNFLGSQLYEVDNPQRLRSWELADIRDHDLRGDCDGTSFEYGTWGGLKCTKCGK